MINSTVSDDHAGLLNNITEINPDIV